MDRQTVHVCFLWSSMPEALAFCNFLEMLYLDFLFVCVLIVGICVLDCWCPDWKQRNSMYSSTQCYLWEVVHTDRVTEVPQLSLYGCSCF